jgi:hypothetical protein
MTDDVFGGSGDGLRLAPGSEDMSALDAKYVAFTRLAELLFDVANTVHGITSPS